MIMQYWWNDNDRGKPKYSEKTLSNCHFVNHKSQMESSRDQTLPSAT